jgi:hypothetical protein
VPPEIEIKEIFLETKILTNSGGLILQNINCQSHSCALAWAIRTHIAHISHTDEFFLPDSPRGATFLHDPNRLNVAVSRARALAIEVGSPDIAAARRGSIEEMELVNLFCWLIEAAS